jgi:hypothetical protein
LNFLEKYSNCKLGLISLLGATLIAYPNIACLPWELSFLDNAQHPRRIAYFLFCYAIFIALTWVLMKRNLSRVEQLPFGKRLLYNFWFCLGAYLIFVGASVFLFKMGDCFGSLVVFQFIVACLLPTFLGYISQLYSLQQAKQQEIDRLKTENLQSRCDALANQLNPHFFFNSLNGLTALVRKKDSERALTFIGKLSDIFRYILQSDKNGIQPLADELDFVQAFRYLMEVRFADKLSFDIQVPQEKMVLRLPVLSLLPLIDNIVVHNIIDSRHKMLVRIYLNAADELVVSNPVYPKLSPAVTNGIGLKNLESRFSLLMGKQIRTEDDGLTFSVFLPLSH